MENIDFGVPIPTLDTRPAFAALWHGYNMQVSARIPRGTGHALNVFIDVRDIFQWSYDSCSVTVPNLAQSSVPFDRDKSSSSALRSSTVIDYDVKFTAVPGAFSALVYPSSAAITLGVKFTRHSIQLLSLGSTSSSGT